MSAIAWADVLHWHFGRTTLWRGLDLQWARLLHKPGVIEFWGTDIRVAETEAVDNPYFALHAPSEYRVRQTRQRSFETQAQFAGAGFSCIVADAGMLSYVRRDLFPKVHLVRQRLFLSEYVPRDPARNRGRLLVVHSPSDPRLKGSEFVQAAVDKLQGRYEFDFRLVHGIPRGEALAILNTADIFIDQLILGTHGLAALEAMALAKPVICYIKPSLIPDYPVELPVLNANPTTITDVLETLLANAERRRILGLQGRAYIEKYHDATALAHQLSAIYEETIVRG